MGSRWAYQAGAYGRVACGARGPKREGVKGSIGDSVRVVAGVAVGCGARRGQALATLPAVTNNHQNQKHRIPDPIIDE